MRIGVSGHGGTGKTTLTHSLSTHMGLPFVGEGVHEWAAAHPAARLWDLQPGAQLGLQNYAIDYKIERERTLPAFVSDRTTVDAVSLLTLRLERFGQRIPDDFRDRALRHARDTYDLALVFEPNRISPEPDEIARIDPRLRRREYELTAGLYESLGTPIVRIPPLLPAEIQPFVLEALRKYRIQRCRDDLRSAAAAHLDEHSAALYLWGSVLSDDFLANSSDVDAILISESTAARDAIEGMRQTARARDPLFERLDLSVVSLEEWRCGQRSGPLERIEPDILFSQVRDAVLVWGRTGLLPLLPVIPLARQLELRRLSLERRLQLHASDPSQEPLKYVLKELGFICHLHHQLETGVHAFSYAALSLRATAMTRPAVEALLEARRNGWNGDSGRIRAIVQRLNHDLAEGVPRG